MSGDASTGTGAPVGSSETRPGTNPATPTPHSSFDNLLVGREYTFYSTHIPARELYQKELMNFAEMCVLLYEKN
jgi:hypothetical protein